MNNYQISAFLASVENLNFTAASHQLFISQPGLSRQIAAMERELGVKLFERGRNSIKITEAGEICAEYLLRIRNIYLEMTDQLSKLQVTNDLPLILGGLEGQLIGKSYEEAITTFWVSRPNSDLRISYYPATRLVKALQDGEVDIAILPETEVVNIPGIAWKRARRDKCRLVVPRSHPKATAKNVSLKDFANETFLIVSESDSSAISRQHRQICESVGFAPKQRIVDSFGMLSILLEIGIGVSVLNVYHSLFHNPNLEFLDIPEVGYRTEVVAWRISKQDNPNIKLFLGQISEITDD